MAIGYHRMTITIPMSVQDLVASISSLQYAYGECTLGTKRKPVLVMIIATSVYIALLFFMHSPF